MERAAKLLLMFSLSASLLAASWYMLGRELPQVREAQARSTVQLGHPVVALWADGNSARALAQDGTIWYMAGLPEVGNNQWYLNEFEGPTGVPVPVDEILFWEWKALVTTDGTGWRWEVDRGWISTGGQPPVGPVSSSSSSAGSLKGRFRN